MIFKVASVARGCLRPESAPVSERCYYVYWEWMNEWMNEWMCINDLHGSSHPEVF